MVLHMDGLLLLIPVLLEENVQQIVHNVPHLLSVLLQMLITLLTLVKHQKHVEQDVTIVLQPLYVHQHH